MRLEKFIEEIKERIVIGLIPIKIEMNEKIYINLLKMVSIDITEFKSYDGTVIDKKQELFGVRIIVKENVEGTEDNICRISYKDGSIEVIKITKKQNYKEDLEKTIVNYKDEYEKINKENINLKNENQRIKEIIIKLTSKLK